MIMPNGSPVNEWQFEATAVDEEPVDFESFFNMLAEKSGGDYSQNGLADPSSSIAPCSESASHVGVNEHPQTQNGSLVFPHPRHTETSASRTFCSSDSYDLGSQALNSGFLKVESHPDVFPMHSAGSVGDWVMPIPEHAPPWLTNPGVTQDFLPFNQHCTRETSSDRANSNETFWFTSGNGNGNHPLVDEYGKTEGTFYDSVTNIYNPLVAPGNVQAPFVDPSRYSNFLNDPNQFSMSYLTSINEPSYFAPSRWNQSSGQNDQMLFNLETESEEIIMQNALRNSAINYQNLTERAHGVALVDWNCDIGPYVSVNGSNTCYRITESSLARPDKESTSGNHWLHTCNLPNKKVGCVKDEKRDAPVATPGTACKKQSPADRKSLVIGQRSTLGAPPTCTGFNNARLKTKDERSVHHTPSQDFSRRKSDISLDDALAVPLLRHQRIALSWMVKKETKSMRCSGGILADDQGLGKTISTISLILKERAPPPSSVHAIETKQNKIETLNLDDDNDVESSVMANGSSKSCLTAGTLVVCPTSVLRQWNEELHNKVRNEANLSVLVYHGGNRTKDPFELTKYDVVLTTYAIVTMEVPKQSLDEDDTETKIINDLLPIKISPSKKRKYPPSFDENSKKDNEPSEPIDRPLAKLRWFRVILDEAQCIKNYRTQVARACWGLWAKRRWCLSGTPIQNSVDDLYSYFRFLKYNPYAVFSSFCSIIKAPIQRNPVTGYKKLQVILKTIMLRRTKGSLLNGEPIILLPPKTITLKKVEFTAEERGFYRRLEADSRAQFAEYAAAGTVKQNYINILLLLLRLRQACDHPLLVRECSSNSEWRLSVEKAKKLPHEKLIRLLNCLEASLAICGICNDPPEDAVVTTCEHVFCNQCILDHLSSDASQCPSSECKDLLSRSSVFSKSALGASTGDNTVECSGSVIYEALEPSSSNGLVGSLQIEAANALNSSKIKAALEFLLSVSKPRDTNNNPNEKSVVREKSIVFSQWTGMLDLLETCLKDSSIGYRRLDGTMSVVARDKAVKDFNALPEVTVMIMSLKAASLGLNMVAACHVILLDLWWNPTTEDQAIDRVHRIGQTRPVTVVRLTVKDTVEDRILALQQKKREMVASAFGEDETGGSQTRLTVDDMKYLFQA